MDAFSSTAPIHCLIQYCCSFSSRFTSAELWGDTRTAAGSGAQVPRHTGRLFGTATTGVTVGVVTRTRGRHNDTCVRVEPRERVFSRWKKGRRRCVCGTRSVRKQTIEATVAHSCETEDFTSSLSVLFYRATAEVQLNILASHNPTTT